MARLLDKKRIWVTLIGAILLGSISVFIFQSCGPSSTSSGSTGTISLSLKVNS